MYSPAAIEQAPAASPARPVSTTAPLEAAPPTTPVISAKLETSPSIAPNTAGRSQPPFTSRWCPSAGMRGFGWSSSVRGSLMVALTSVVLRRRLSPAASGHG